MPPASLKSSRQMENSRFFSVSPLVFAEPWKNSDKVVSPFKELLRRPPSGSKRGRSVSAMTVPCIYPLSFTGLGSGQDLGVLSLTARQISSLSGSSPRGWEPVVPSDSI